MASMKVSARGLATVYRADIEASARLVASGLERKKLSPEHSVILWDSFRDILESETVEEEAGEAAYASAVDILYAQELRVARVARLPPIMTGAELMATDFGPRRDRVKRVTQRPEPL